MKIIIPLLIAILIQIPLGYLFISLESFVLGHGFIGFQNGIGFYLYATIIVATVVILVIGLPTYFALKHFNLNSTLNVTLVGFLIPAIIISFVSLLPSYEGYSAGENYYGTYREMFTSGVRTYWGWVKFFESIITYGVHGIVGAIIFHKMYTINKGA